jgi:hypothetical protein
MLLQTALACWLTPEIVFLHLIHVKGTIFFFPPLFLPHFYPRRQGECIGVAYFKTFLAQLTGGKIDALFPSQICIVIASAKQLFTIKHRFSSNNISLLNFVIQIRTPDTGQWASFKKDYGAYSATVVYGVTLNIKMRRSRHTLSSFSQNS